MDQQLAAVISAASTIVAALFGALMFSMRQSREDWRGLYNQLFAKLEADQRDDAENSRKNSEAFLRLGTTVEQQGRTLEKIVDTLQRDEPQPRRRP